MTSSDFDRAPLEYASPDVRRSERRATAARRVAVVAMLVGALGIGMALSLIDRAASRAGATVVVVAAGVEFAAVAFVVASATRVLARARPRVMIAAAAVVLAAIVASMVLFDAAGLGRAMRSGARWGPFDTVGTELFATRLYLCWAPTVLVGAVVLTLRPRDGRHWSGLATAAACGLTSAVLWGAQASVGPHAGWWQPRPFKAVANGLVLVALVVLGQTLAGEWESFRRRPGSRKLV